MPEINEITTENLSKLRQLRDSLKKDFLPGILPVPAEAPGFFERHPRIRVGLSLGVLGLFVFFDTFLGVSTVLGGVMSSGLAILAISLTAGAALVGLMFLLQLSSLSRVMKWFAPPKDIQPFLEARALLKEIHELQGYDASLEPIRAKIQAYADALEQKRLSKRTQIIKGGVFSFLALTSATGGFSIGYFMVESLVICFSGFISPFWLPMLLGALVGAVALATFWDRQRADIFQMVEWALGCDNTWISALKTDTLTELKREPIGRDMCEREEAMHRDALEAYFHEFFPRPQEGPIHDRESQGLSAVSVSASSS